MQNSYLSRRTVIKAGGTAGLAALLAAATAGVGIGHKHSQGPAPQGTEPW